MAYSLDAGSIVEIQYRYSLQSQQCINVFHYRLTESTGDGAAAIDAALADFWDKLGNFMLTRQTSDIRFPHLRGQAVYPQRYNYRTYTPTETTGAQDPPTASIGTAAVFRRKSEIAGVTANGRFFLGGIPITAIDIGTLVDPWKTEAITTVCPGVTLNLDGNAEPDLLSPVVWSYSDPTTNHDIIDCLLDNYVRYQRRREVGRGE